MAGSLPSFQKSSKVNVILKNLTTGKKLPSAVHVNRLKHAHDRNLECDVSENGVPITQTTTGVEPVLDPVLSSEPPSTPVNAPEGGLPNGVDLDASDDTDEFCAIDRLIRGRRRGRFVEYLVRWKGHSDDHNSWVKYGDLNAACRQWLKENAKAIKVSGRRRRSGRH